jgi:hypothetical protein
MPSLASRPFIYIIALLLNLQSIHAHTPNRFPVKQDKKWGYIDRTGKLVIPLTFSDAEKFDDGLAAVRDHNTQKWGYIDTAGNFVITPQFDDAMPFDSGCAAVKLNDFWGFINRSGAFTMTPQFDDVTSSDPPAVNNDGLGYWQYVNETCTALTNILTNIPHGFYEGLTAIKFGDKYGYVDIRGALVIPPKFDEPGEFSESLAPVNIGGKWGAIDKAGQIIIEPRFDWTMAFFEGVAVVEVERKNGFIRKDGTWLLQPTYPYLRAMSESRAVFSDKPGGKHGFLDQNGMVVIPPQFDNTDDFEHGLAKVEVKGRIGYIDPQGHYVWKPR